MYQCVKLNWGSILIATDITIRKDADEISRQQEEKNAIHKSSHHYG